MSEPSIQERLFPDGDCFGCGPRNPHGLRIRSLPREDGSTVCTWEPAASHGNGSGVVCGGILATLLDCHGNSAAMHGLGRISVTKEFRVEFLRPTPMTTLELVARVTEQRSRSAAVEAEVRVGGELCARMQGVFVAARDPAAD